MINRIIRASLENRALVLLLAVMLTAVGVHAVLRTPVDALPDLSDVQVIVRTPYPGQAPRVVEDQVTYPLTTALLSVPGATTVRGYSFYGDSFVNVLFADGTDPYWARSRVLEYLSQATARLPEGVRPALGPDATGVGWIYQYALIDRTGGTTSRNCAACRTGSSSSSCRRSTAWPRSRRSAAWSSSTRSSSIRCACAATASR